MDGSITTSAGLFCSPPAYVPPTFELVPRPISRGLREILAHDRKPRYSAARLNALNLLTASRQHHQALCNGGSGYSPAKHNWNGAAPPLPPSGSDLPKGIGNRNHPS